MKSFTKLFALGAVLAASSTLAFGSTVTPGGAPTSPDSLTPTLVGAPLDTVSGTIDTATSASDTTFVAMYSESVYESTGNSGCAAAECLTFEISYTNDSGQANERLTVGPGAGSTGFLSFTDDVGDLSGGSGIDPTTVDEDINGVIGFSFAGDDAIGNGDSTNTLIIETNATAYTTGLFSAIDSSTGTVEGLVPTVAAATPEPNSLLLMGTGLVAAAGLLFMRRRAAMTL